MIAHTTHKVWHQHRVQQTRNLTEGNPYSLIIRFALPIFLSQVFQQLYNAADSVIVGQFLGTDALAAVSSSGTLIFLMVSFFNGTALGAGVVISHCFGARDEDGVSRAIHTDLAFGIVAGVVLTVAGVLLTPTFLVWMGTDPEVLPQAIEYFRYYFFGVIAVVLYNICTGIMNAVGDSRRALLPHLLLAHQRRARPALYWRVPLGRLVGRLRHHARPDHELRPLLHTPD